MNIIEKALEYIVDQLNIIYDRMIRSPYLQIKWAFQRVFRGWDDRAYWNVDVWTCRFLAEIIHRLAEKHQGYPGRHAIEAFNRIGDEYINLEDDIPDEKAEEICDKSWTRYLHLLAEKFELADPYGRSLETKMPNPYKFSHKFIPIEDPDSPGTYRLDEDKSVSEEDRKETDKYLKFESKKAEYSHKQMHSAFVELEKVIDYLWD